MFVQLFSCCEDRSDDLQAPYTLDWKLEVLCILFSVFFDFSLCLIHILKSLGVAYKTDCVHVI